MARISSQAKQRYLEKIKQYKAELDGVQNCERELLKQSDSDPSRTAHVKLDLADCSLNAVSYFLLMNMLSKTILGVRNEAFLNDARKGCYKSLIYLEEVVTSFIDTPYSDLEDRLELISDVDEERRYSLVKKLGFTIQSVIEGFGDNTKWRWSFVELEGRFTTITKNLINMKTLYSGLDPRSADYETRTAHLGLTKQLLQKSADDYRRKYELSTNRIDDFKLAISYLSALRRINILLGETDEGENLKKKIEIWSSKMESDLKRSEQKPHNQTK